MRPIPRRFPGSCLALVLPVLVACGPAAEVPDRRRMPGADAERGRAILVANTYGCGACHAIPGVAARGMVGPPLHGMGLRAYVAGRLPNGPENLALWIHDPKRVDPLTAMPVTGISPGEARDVAAYLYTLRTVPR